MEWVGRGGGGREVATNDYPEIRAALEARLALVPGIPATTQWQGRNKGFDRPMGQQWLTHRVHWGAEQLISKPVWGGYLQRNGVYQVVLYFPLDRDSPDPDVLAQAVVDTFPIGLTLVNGSTTVYIGEPRRWEGGIDLEEGFYGIPVDIPWYVQRPNPLL